MLPLLMVVILAGDGKPLPKPAGSRPVAAQVFKSAAPSVVVVMAKTKDGLSQGSGVVVGRGLVVTNKHVIDKAIGDVLVVQGKKSWRGQVTSRAKTDLAIVELLVRVGECSGPPVVAVRSSATIEVGEPVFAIGTPRGFEQTLSEGIISGLQVPDAQGHLVLQTTAALSEGSSGGGLFDSKGRLVGVTTLTVRESQQLNFAISSDLVRRLVRGDEDVLDSETPPAEPASDEPEPYTPTPTPPPPPAPAPPAPFLPKSLADAACFDAEVDVGEAARAFADETYLRSWLLGSILKRGIATSMSYGPCPVVLGLTVDGFMNPENTIMTYVTRLVVRQFVTFSDGEARVVETWTTASYGYAGSRVAADAVGKAVYELFLRFTAARVERPAQ